VAATNAGPRLLLGVFILEAVRGQTPVLRADGPRHVRVTVYTNGGTPATAASPGTCCKLKKPSACGAQAWRRLCIGAKVFWRVGHVVLRVRLRAATTPKRSARPFRASWADDVLWPV